MLTKPGLQDDRRYTKAGTRPWPGLRDDDKDGLLQLPTRCALQTQQANRDMAVAGPADGLEDGETSITR